MNQLRSSHHPLDFGLVAWLENTRIALPLKGVECRFDVTGTIASVELDQIYHQNARQPMECTYTFPLPAGAAVYRCEVHFNGRVIRAKVESKEQARQIYTEQKAAGRRAALVESDRENLFTLSLGNVQPDDVIVVRFAWFQVLDRTGESLRLLVPTCPGIRYIPGQPLLRGSSGRGIVDDTDQVPDASRITPPRIDALHVDAAYFSIQGRLSRSEVESGTATSASHTVRLREHKDTMTVELAEQGAVPDRDFVLIWREPLARHLTPAAWHWREGDDTYALIQLRAPETLAAPTSLPQDFYFLVDRSGSMEGAKWARTCEALHAFVGLLGADDRVWITLFESTCQDFAEAPMPAPQVLADPGFQRMGQLAPRGGTHLLPAALRILEQIPRHSADRRASVVLITDGQVGNEPEILSAFQHAPDVRVHTFGIDTTVNDAFLKTLSRQHRGGCWLQTPDDDISGTIAALGGRLRHPVLTDLALRGPWEPAQETWPDLHVRELVSVALRGQGTIPPEIVGRSADGCEQKLAADLGTIGSEAVKLLWARGRITELLASNRKTEAIEIAKKYNLVCEGAAFIAWDEAEQVAIATDGMVQPSHSPGVIGYSRAAGAGASVCFYPSFPTSAPSELYDVASSDGHGDWDSVNEASRLPSLVAETREALQRVALPESTLNEWLAWLESDDALAESRANALQIATAHLDAMRRDTTMPAFRDHLDLAVGPATTLGPEAFSRWAAQVARSFETLREIRHKLKLSGTPPEVIDLLCVWTMASDPFDPVRVDRLVAFVESLRQLPFSAAATSYHWQAFAHSNFEADGQAHSVITRWLSDTNLETVRNGPTQ